MSQEELLAIVGPLGIESYREFLRMYGGRFSEFKNDCKESIDLMTLASMISAIEDNKVTITMSKEQASISAFLMLNGWCLFKRFVEHRDQY